MNGALLKAKTFFLDLLFPMECLGCEEAGTYLCAACFAKIPLEESSVCPACFRPSFEGSVCEGCKKHTPLNGLIAAASYRIPMVKRMITGLKYRSVRDLAPHLSALILKRLFAHDYSVFHLAGLMLVPTPLDDKRMRWRGFNQACEIARGLGEALGIPVCDNALMRVRNAIPQAETASREERFTNLKGVFAVSDATAVRGKTILLVDDVATTTATLSACAMVLKDAGAKEVWGLVAARER